MTSYVLRRLWQMLPILLAVALLIFFIFSVVPGTFASSSAADGRNVVDAQVMERMNKEFGLSDPVHVRFGKYVAQLARFDLGTSFRSRVASNQRGNGACCGVERNVSRSSRSWASFVASENAAGCSFSSAASRLDAACCALNFPPDLKAR